MQETLTHYLMRSIKSGVIDFSIRATDLPLGEIKFYIHPTNTSGDTLDFRIHENHDGSDVLINEKSISTL